MPRAKEAERFKSFIYEEKSNFARAWNGLTLANNPDSHLRREKNSKSRQTFKLAAFITLMSVSPKPSERLTEILREILALSNSTRTSKSESARGSNPMELFDAHWLKELSQRPDEETKPGKDRSA